MNGWTFLTNHSHVLLSIAENKEIRLRDVAEKVGITERAAQRIVADLIKAGYLSSTKVGRRNRYEVHPSQPLRHPVEQHCRVQSILQMVAPSTKGSASGFNRSRTERDLHAGLQTTSAEPAAFPAPGWPSTNKDPLSR